MFAHDDGHSRLTGSRLGLHYRVIVGLQRRTDVGQIEQLALDLVTELSGR